MQHLNVRALENICQDLNLNKMFDTFIKVSPVNQLNWCQRITHLLHKLMTISWLLLATEWESLRNIPKPLKHVKTDAHIILLPLKGVFFHVVGQ